MRIAIAMRQEQLHSLIRELQECVARDAKSVILYTTDEPETITQMEAAHSSVVPNANAIPVPDLVYAGTIWPLAFDSDVVDAAIGEAPIKDLN